jgi:hypothetical protein
MPNEKDYSNKFSDHYKMILAYARDKAYFLGSTKVEPIHLILGEIDHQYYPGISSHIFKDQAHLERVIKNFTLGDPIAIPHPDEGLSDLTDKVQGVIRKSYGRAKKLGVDLVEPYHMFIVLEEIDSELFRKITEGTEFNCKEFYLKTYGLNLYLEKGKLIYNMLRLFGITQKKLTQ